MFTVNYKCDANNNSVKMQPDPPNTDDRFQCQPFSSRMRSGVSADREIASALAYHGSVESLVACLHETVHSQAWLSMQNLSLSNRHLQAEHVHKFVDMANNCCPQSLRALDLSGNDIGPEGAGALAKCEAFSGLHALYLNKVSLGYTGLETFASGKALRNLRALHLCCNALGGRSVIDLASWEGPTMLQELSLANNHLNGEDIPPLA